MPSWKPLDDSKSQIRLLELSSRDSNPFTCHLITVDLQDEPEYEALSYAWGSISDDPKEVYLDGLALPVTRNLHDTLTTLRWKDETRTLWVDALCIDQADHTERSHQVAMMGSIYAKASRVLVWLSPRYCGGNFDEQFPILRGINRAKKYPKQEDPELSEFLERHGAWWYRAWTFQEGVMGRQLLFHVGDETFTDEDLDIILGSMVKYRPLRDSISSITKHRSLGTRREHRLLVLVIDNDHRIATDPRDSFYAYVGIATDPPSDFIRYDLPLKDWVVYTTMKLIQHNQSLELLPYAVSPILQKAQSASSTGNKTLSRKHLPSWCADSTQPIGPLIPYNPLRNSRFYAGRDHSSRRITRHVSFHPPNLPDSMNISGVHCGKVARVGESNKGMYISDREMEDIKARHKLDYRAANEEVAHRIMGRRLVNSDNGYMGWGPEDARVDDIIALLYGAEKPFLLRGLEESRMEAGKEVVEYTLVGEIRGLTYGEAMKAAEEGKLREQIFCLR